MKEEEFGYIYSKFGMPLRHISCILKKITNIDLYKLVSHLSSFRKPIICGLTTLVYVSYVTVNSKTRSVWYCSSAQWRWDPQSFHYLFFLTPLTSCYRMASPSLFCTRILNKMENDEETVRNSETEYYQNAPDNNF